MPLTHNNLIEQLLMPALFVFLLVAGIAGAVFGLALIFWRSRVLRALGALNRWVSGPGPLAALETVHTIEPTVHKYRRWFGGVFIVCAAFSLTILFGRLSVGGVIALLGANSHSAVAAWLVASLGWMMVVGSVLALAIGVVLGFFPRLLVWLEERANRWYSPHQLLKGADEMHDPLDRLVGTFPVVAGWIIVMAGMTLALNAALVLISRY